MAQPQRSIVMLTLTQWSFVRCAGLKLHASLYAVDKWRIRGRVPWMYRHAIAAMARESGVKLPKRFTALDAVDFGVAK